MEKRGDKALAANQQIEERDYWLNRFAVTFNRSSFPFDAPGSADKGVIGVNEKSYSLPGDIYENLLKISKGLDHTLHIILCAALAGLLHRILYNDNDYVLIGTPIYKQKKEADFINTVLPLLCRVNGNQTFKELLLEMKGVLVEAIKHQDYPVELLPRHLGLEESGKQEGYFPLFANAILLTNIHECHYLTPVKLEMVFSFTRTEAGIEGLVQYSTALFREAAIERFILLLNRFLAGALNGLDSPIGQLDILGDEEKQRLVKEFNRTGIEYRQGQTLHGLLAEQVEQTPDTVAVVGPGPGEHGSDWYQITYRELNREADKLARVLTRNGVFPDSLVGLMVERSLDMIIGMLGILKAGGAYLPVDPGYPVDRKDYMLADSQSGLLVMDGEQGIGHGFSFADGVGEKSGLKVWVRDGVKKRNGLDGGESLEPANTLAYTIYTSGTTGKPKGVLVQHGNAVNVVSWFARSYEIKPGRHVLQLSEYTFDASVNQVFGTLLHGGTLYLIAKEMMIDFQAMHHFINRHQIYLVNFVPQFLKEMLTFGEKLESIQLVLSGGEKLDSPTRDLILGRGYRLFNQYGPTETTVDALAAECKTGKAIDLGRPIANTQCYIVANDYQLLPLGIPGELVISGHGVTRGYLNNPALTAGHFIPLQFLGVEMGVPGQRGTGRPCFYKTGDMARWLPGGTIEFLGRKDSQVKIRGFRIELGEIEKRLSSHPGVKEGVVRMVERDGVETPQNKYLCAYIVPIERRDIQKRGALTPALKEYLSLFLPEYMVPSRFIYLESLPLTPTGKVDRRSLPEPGNIKEEAETPYAPPVNSIQEKLISIWADILPVDAGVIGIHHHFFRLGGHSLNAAITTARVHQELNVKIPLQQFFLTPTVAELAEYIGQARKNIYQAIEAIEEKEYYLQSSAQKRLFFLDWYEDIGTSYNIPSAVIVKGNLDKERLEKACQRLIKHQKALRTSFHIIDQVAIQRVHETVDFLVHYQELQPGVGSVEKEELESFFQGFIQPFDLSIAPLLRVSLVRIEEKRFLLMFDMHHIIGDGTSMGILIDDFCTFYEGKEPGVLALGYQDFTGWQNSEFHRQELQYQEKYWRDQFSDHLEMEPLVLPYDYPRPPVLRFEGQTYSFQVNEMVTQQLREYIQANNSTLFMTLLSFFYILLYRYSGQEDMVIGTGIMGRPRPDLQKIIGMFVNTLAIRTTLNGQMSTRDFTQQVKHKCIDAFENQDMQFEELVEKLGLRREPSRNPLFDVLLVVQNFATAKRALADVAIEMVPYENKTAKFDISLYANEFGPQVFLVFEYSTALFKLETMERMATHFLRIIEHFTGGEESGIADVELLSNEEKELLLDTFNEESAAVSPGKTMVDFFEEQVEKRPDLVAMVSARQGLLHLTYAQLNQDANQLAHYLSREKNIGPDQPVGLFMERGAGMIIGIMGILKAGGAYVPFDPAFPGERVKSMTDDAGITVLVSQKCFIKTLNRLQWSCPSLHTYICLDSHDVHGEEETEKSELMGRHLWEYVGETAVDDITGGGWLSSYTGQPISKQEMDEYGDNVLKKLTPLLHKKMKVLEIGCASGISMFRIAPLVGAYYGTDLSRVIIEKNQERINQQGINNIFLSGLAAHEINQIGENNFDLVIINSVIQCFHGHNYLGKVLANVVQLIGDKGYLFIGDIMDQDLKEDLIKDLRRFKQAHRDRDFTTKIDWSTELFTSPNYFRDLSLDIPGMIALDFSPKIYTIENELTQFRYDLLITIDKTKKTSPLFPRQKYQDDARALENQPVENPVNRLNPGHLAYIIYTSGSTGRPKGTLTSHGNIGRVVKDTNYICFKPRDRVLQLSNYAFDGSVFDIYGALLNGGALVLLSREQVLDMEQLAETIIKEHIQIFFVTTALFNTLIDLRPEALENVRAVLFGGEQVSVSHTSRAFDRLGPGRVYHVYGPTETTVYATCYPIHHIDARQATLPIGRPITATTVYILDQNLKPVPLGVAGELYIGGQGVARGYLNQPGLTAEKFISFYLPGKKKTLKPGQTSRITLYRSGDLARYLPDGQIIFLGRIDQQVKIRGFRIEPGEIRQLLAEHDDLLDALVLDCTGPTGELTLAAYYIPHPGKHPNEEDLKEFLSFRLPGFMIPGYFIPIERIPLTANGKLDRKALPAPGKDESTPDRELPGTETEKRLAKTWSEILGIENPGIDDNFFERGGHSLKATILISRIRKEFAIDFPLTRVFSEPTIRAMALYISRAKKSLYSQLQPVENKDYYPQSSAQKRLFLLDRLGGIKTGFNMTAIYQLQGQLDYNRYQQVFHQLIQRHESLRTSFHWVNDQPVQRIHDYNELEFQVMIHPGRTTDKNQTETIIKKFARPFDLAIAPLLRVEVIHLDNQCHILLVDMHHIISDGSSLALLADEFIHLYTGETLPKIPIQYRDFSEWQNHLFSSGQIKEQEKYWLSVFPDAPATPVLNLPLDYPRPPLFDFTGRRWQFKINAEIHQAILALTRQWEKENGEATGSTTLFMIMLAAFNTLLFHYTQQEDIIVGTGTAGRPHPGLQPVIGMFINSLALRHLPQGHFTFFQFLKQVKNNCIHAFQNQDLPFESLVEMVNPTRDASRNPLFDVSLIVQNFSPSQKHLENVSIQPYGTGSAIAKHDLFIQVFETQPGLILDILYYRSIFKEETIQRLSRHLVHILEFITQNPGTTLDEIELIDDQEKQLLLEQFNPTHLDYPHQQTLVQLFQDQVQATPDRIALVGPASGNQRFISITYRQLHQRASIVAAYLREKGAGPDCLVAVMCERSLDLIIATWGILFSGAAYLPIDPDYPQERKNYLLADSQPSLLLTTTPEAITTVENISLPSLFQLPPATPPHEPLFFTGKPANLAYVIYTSGTTGQPKGTLVEHRQVVHLCSWFKSYYFYPAPAPLPSPIHTSQYYSPGFDASIVEIFPPLLAGHTLYIIPGKIKIDIQQLTGFFQRYLINLAFLPTQLCELYMTEAEEVPSLQFIQTGGEKLNLFHPRQFKLINAYGPTETTVMSTAFPVKTASPHIPIGKPIGHTRVYITRETFQHYFTIQPTGIPGELLIAGPGVSRGYLNRPELTTQKFIVVQRSSLTTPATKKSRLLPLPPGSPHPGNETLYRTGDLARWLPDGNIEFLGRTDLQIQIRGHRVEPGEIENQLKKLPSIKNATIIAHETTNREYVLCAYIIPSLTTPPPHENEIKNSLSTILPSYMVPTHYIFLEKFPLTIGGKINHQALPQPGDTTRPIDTYISPRNRIEEKLVTIWTEILDRDSQNPIGTNDDFFQLGGHSLKATLMVLKIQKAFHIKIPLEIIFKKPFIKDLAAYIRTGKKDALAYEDIGPTEKKEYYPLSSAQKRLFLLDSFDNSGTSYNIPIVYKIAGNVETNRYETIFQQLIDRHESLRTSFHWLGDTPVQRIHESQDITFSIQYTQNNELDEENQNQIKNFIQPFNLAQAPLLRVGMIENPRYFILMIDVHHIIADGTSAALLMDEFIRLYSGETLEKPLLQYRDFSTWQNQVFQLEVMQTQEKYWQETLAHANHIPHLALPYDYPRPPYFSFAGANCHFMLDAIDTLAFREITSRQVNATLFMNLLAALTSLFYRYTGQEDMIIGTGIAGRPHIDLQRIMGMFINTLALRCQPQPTMSYHQYLEEIKNKTLMAFENQDIPFESLVEQLNPVRDPSRHPFFNVYLIVQNFQGTTKTMKDVTISWYGTAMPIAKFDLTLNVMEMDDQLNLYFEYCSSLFKKETIENMAHHLVNIIHQVSLNPDLHLRELDIVSEKEKEFLLRALDQTSSDFPMDKDISALFAQQVEHHPLHQALVCLKNGENPLPVTYQELALKASNIAALLRQHGIANDTIVAIAMEPGLELIASILGILQAGGAYLPIDPEYPQERINYMLKDSQASLLLVNETFAIDTQINVLPITPSNQTAIPDDSIDFPKKQPTLEPLAYIIYTSGSTGKPKGTAITLRNLTRLFFSQPPLFDFNPQDTWTLFHSPSFDFSVWEMYGALLFGGRLAVFPRSIARDTLRFRQVLAEQKVTILNQTPSAFYQLIAADREFPGHDLHLRYIIFGGEALNPAKLQEWKNKYNQTRLINMYGITETTVHVTFKEIGREEMKLETSNIGKPIPTLGIVILDRDLRLVPRGVAGEICVYGEGLARGYLNQPQLTAQKFIPHPYDPQQLIYRSGDLGRLLENGDLAHLGRIDQQVKIRGFRIELGEIETQLMKTNSIKQALVIARTDPQRGTELQAFVVPLNEKKPGEKNFSLDIPGLKAFLALHLPAYMIPPHITPIERIPLTIHGKADVNALPSPQRSRIQLDSPFAAPMGKLEKTLTFIWSEILNMNPDEIGTNDNFFDLGGNSLDIVKLSNKIKEVVQTDVRVIQLFDHPTIHSLATFITGIEPGNESKPLPQEAATLKETLPKIKEDQPAHIAIIGMAGRFPGADNINQFWENLCHGVESISFYTDQELRNAGVPDSRINHPRFVKSNGSTIADREYFDAAFFDYTPQQAEVASPQLRLLHECVWQALEHAGYPPEDDENIIGLFAGLSSSFTWEALALLSGKTNILGYFATLLLTNKDHGITHVAYKLNLKGPAISVQTACSTSLVAVDMAVHALLDNQCHIALAGGSTIVIGQSQGYMYEEGMINSADGHCRAFDEAASGLTGGEGAGLVVLKKLENALQDHDTIHAIILSTAVNNDGNRKVGYTAPSIQGQADVIQAAIARANIPAESITYVETHGTGTTLGDPVEIQGLTRGFNTKKTGFCRIGSVKTNIGHLDAAAGAAGLIKTILALQHQQIPPSLHFKNPNPAIDFPQTPFIVNTQLTPWINTSYPLRAGVSSFGIGGTNAHIILEQAPSFNLHQPESDQTHPQNPNPALLLLSAKSPTTLDQAEKNLAHFFKQHPETSIQNAAYTLQVGRTPFKHRRFVVAANLNDAINELEQKRISRSHGLAPETPPPIVFMLAGLGSQYVNMGRHLYEQFPAFHHTMDSCFTLLSQWLDVDLKKILYPLNNNQPDLDTSNTVDHPKIVQPLIFALEYSLATLLISWGITPTAMIGYSFGEYVAATVAQVFTLEEALHLVVKRSQLIDGINPGAMLSVPVDKTLLLPLLAEKKNIALAIDNGDSCIVSGELQAVLDFENEAQKRKWVCLRLPTHRAIHSPMMLPLQTQLEKTIENMQRLAPTIPYISNVTGDWAQPDQVTSPSYWSDHLCHPVEFAQGMKKLIENPETLFIEIGPGRDMSNLASRYLKNKNQANNPSLQVFNLVRHPSESINDVHYLLTKIGQLWLNGIKIHWKKLTSPQLYHRIPLPSTPFNRQRYWNLVDSFKPAQLPLSPLYTHHTLPISEKSQRDMAHWFYVPTWEQLPQTSFPSSPTQSLTHKNDFSPDLNHLLFLNQTPIEKTLLKYLNEQHHPVISITPGNSFQQETPIDHLSTFIIDPRQPDHYDRLFKELKNQNRIPDEILYLWSLTPTPPSFSPAEKQQGALINYFQQFLEKSFYPLLNLVQAIGRQNITTPLRLTVLTNNMQDVFGGEVLHPEQALMLGAVKSIPLEYPHIRCRTLDILLPSNQTQPDQTFIQQLLPAFTPPHGEPEANNEKNPEPEVLAIRGNYTWKPRLNPVLLEKTREKSPRLREKGVYLISGGFGGMGFTLAQLLAYQYQAKLILIGRSPWPDRQQWPQILAQPTGNEDICKKIQTILNMETQGAEVMPVCADVANLQDMRQTIDQAQKRFGTIHGVIHTAAIIDYGGIIQRRSIEDTQKVLAPKAIGLIVLDSLIQTEKLDFFMIFSSIASVLTPFGQVGYTSANAFLDAFSFSKNTLKGKFTVINWSDWLEVGMAIKAINKANPDNPQRIETELKAMQPIALSPAEGTQAFLRMLENPLPRFVVSIQKFKTMHTWHWQSIMNQRSSSPTPPTHKNPHQHHTRPPLSTSYEAPLTPLEKSMTLILQEFLDIDAVGVNDNFFELGLSSLDIIQVNKQLQKTLNRDIPLVTLFSFPTTRHFASHIEANQTPVKEDKELAQAQELLEQSLDLLLPGDE